MALLYKDGVLVHNTIDNDGVSDQASLGARYAKGRLDTMANDLDQNYFTKEEVYDLLDGIAKTYIVSQPPTTPFFLLSEDATAVSTKEYWTVTFVQDTDPLSSEIMFLYERKAFIPSWDTEPHIYYELADPTTWDPGTKTYYKVDTETQRTFTPGEAIQEVVYTKELRYPEPNTYYLVGNDTDGYILYYFDSELEEAVIGSYTLDLSDYQKKFEYDPSLIGGLTDESTFCDVNLNATPTPLISRIKAWVVWNYIKFKAKGGISTALEDNFTLGRALVSNDYGKIAVANTTKAEIERLRGVTSGVQDQLDAKQAKITGAATSIVTNDLTASRALVSNASGKVEVSSTTATEIGYVHGVTKSLAHTEASGANAIVYPSQTQLGLYDFGEYDSNIPRRAWKMGTIANLSFHCKCKCSAVSAGWTLVGNVPSAYRPKYIIPIVAMVYDQNNGNLSAGGYLHTDGRLVLWTDAKTASNNYQVRVNVTYSIS